MNIPGSTDIIILAGNSHPDLAQKIAGYVLFNLFKSQRNLLKKNVFLKITNVSSIVVCQY